MARMFSKDPTFVGGKYLVLRRDNTQPKAPYFVLLAADPAAAHAIYAYADECERLGMDPEYIQDLRDRANEFAAWRVQNGDGDPDGARHRIDDPNIIARMLEGDPS